jgi:glycosyltransferase involved in cell wall biosynthesis
MMHDLGPTGIVIPIHNKLKKLFCLSEWHKQYFLKTFPQFENNTDPYHYGIDHLKFGDVDETKKIRHSFIYSSFPNRGLIVLLKMWPLIKKKIPDATLNIYCDVYNDWSNKNFPEEMKEIQSMLWDESGVEKYYSQGIVYHGWVSKEKLAQGWKQSDVWFYPCKFAETFCLTALEAATTKTLAITNNLAALQNTVGDRGVSIEGDVITKEWQEKALNAIVDVLTNPAYKKELVDKNYEWSQEHTWKKRAVKFYDTYLEDIYKLKKESDL